MKTFEEIKADAMSLDLDHRAELAQVLLGTLDEPSPEELDKLWLEEAARRQREVAEGKVKLVPGLDVLRRLAAIG